MGVNVMSVARLVPGQLYWARSSKHFDGKITIVQVSQVFGNDPDYWTLAVLGSDQHHMPSEFEIVAPAEPPDRISIRYAAE